MLDAMEKQFTTSACHNHQVQGVCAWRRRRRRKLYCTKRLQDFFALRSWLLQIFGFSFLMMFF